MRPPDDKEVWQLAALLIDKHGKDAIKAAEARARDALADDNVLDHAVWLSIGAAAKELLRTAEDGVDCLN